MSFMHAPVNLQRQLPDMDRPLVIVGHSAAMRRIVQEISAAAASNVTVLIGGESGTGRRLIAHTIHARSARCAGPFLTVNCICLPDARLETELFGESQAAVGREHSSSRGRLASAHGGTLVLHDVGYLSWRLQRRLLRFSETRMVHHPGSPLSTPSDVRLITITHRQLFYPPANPAIRDDLFYRLNMIHVEVPPLRERTDDVPALFRYFMSVQSARLGRSAVDLTPDALTCLSEYDWPGNVRELKEVAEELVQKHTSERIGVHHLPPPLVQRSMSRTVARWRGARPR